MSAPAAAPEHVYVLAAGVVGGQTGCPGIVLEGARIRRHLSPAEAPPPDAAVLDLRPFRLAPGTIDLHTHGGVGCSFSSGPPEDTLAVLRYRATTGVTALLPTITGLWDELLAALAKLAALAEGDARPAVVDGAAVLGVHVEGPFLNPVRKGAIDPATMRLPDVEDLRRLQGAASGWIKSMTIAPELPGAMAVIEEAVRLGIVPSVGHSDAAYETVLAAAAAGARKSTHTYNAMRPLLHRDPGTVGGVLADDRIVAELIADGVHVHPGAMRVLLNAKGSQGTCLVTDGVRYAGQPEGVYERPGRGRLTIANGVAKTDDGTIAGSVSPMDRNLRLLHETFGIGLDDLFVMASTVPARLLDRTLKGTLAPGADADFAAYDDTLRCRATFVGGRRVFTSDSPR